MFWPLTRTNNSYIRECALSKVLKLPSLSPPSTALYALLFWGPSHFSCRHFICALSSCDLGIDQVGHHRGHVSLMRATGRKASCRKLEWGCSLRATRRPSSTHTRLQRKSTVEQDYHFFFQSSSFIINWQVFLSWSEKETIQNIQTHQAFLHDKSSFIDII